MAENLVWIITAVSNMAKGVPAKAGTPHDALATYPLSCSVN